MWRYFRSPFAADGHQQSMKHVSFADSTELSGDIELPPRRLANVRRPQVRLGGSNSLELKICVILFALIVLASIALIVVVMTEEPARVHGVSNNLHADKPLFV
jgi:hypothetical protein